VGVAAAASLSCLSWARHALHAWNTAQPHGIDAQIPAFPFVSLTARVIVALSLSLIFAFFILCFFLSYQLGQWMSFGLVALCVAVFFFILLFHCIRTFRACRHLAQSYPWFLHSLAVAVAVLVFEVLWLGQALLVYPLPVSSQFQTFIPLGAFFDATSQVCLHFTHPSFSRQIFSPSLSLRSACGSPPASARLTHSQ